MSEAFGTVFYERTRDSWAWEGLRSLDLRHRCVFGINAAAYEHACKHGLMYTMYLRNRLVKCQCAFYSSDSCRLVLFGK